MNKPIEIYKGDDAGAFHLRRIRITLSTPICLKGATAYFSLLSFNKIFSSEKVKANDMWVELDRNDVRNFPLGYCFGTFALIDADGRVFTATKKIPFNIVNGDKTKKTVEPTGVVVETEIVNINVNIDLTGIVLSYEKLSDKPKISGVEISGDKTAEDFGLVGKEDGYALSMVRDATVNDAGDELTITKADGSEVHFSGGGGGEGAVRYDTAQTLSVEGKAQARSNIAAASNAALSDKDDPTIGDMAAALGWRDNGI